VRVVDGHALRAWILGFGALAHVVGPPELRAWFAETSLRMSQRYQEDVETSLGT